MHGILWYYYFSADECAASPYEQHAKHYAHGEVGTECQPVTFLSEHPHVVGKRRECGETAAETGDKQHIFLCRHHLRLLKQPEEQADNEAADDVDHESTHGK